MLFTPQSQLPILLVFFDMRLSFIAAAGLLVPSANAFWRLPCAKPVLDARVDPIVTPGKPSSHAHSIMGSNGEHTPCVSSTTIQSDTLVLAIGYNTDFGALRSSQCTTCMVRDDKSAYWLPGLVRGGMAWKCPHGN